MTARARQRTEQLREPSMYPSALVSLLCLTALPAFASKPDSVPDWVRTAAQQKLPDYSTETNAVVLLEDITYTVAPDGSAVEHSSPRRQNPPSSGQGRRHRRRPLRQRHQNPLHACLEHRPRRTRVRRQRQRDDRARLSRRRQLSSRTIKVRVAERSRPRPRRHRRLRVRAAQPSLPHREDLVLPERSSAPQPELHPRASARLHLRHRLGPQQTSSRPSTSSISAGAGR